MANHNSEHEGAAEWFDNDGDNPRIVDDSLDGEPRVTIPPNVKLAAGITAMGLLGASIAIARHRLQNKDGEQ